jgi:hypothetical protein
MRALCGAIIAAGALVGLGLTAVGIGMRYELVKYRNEANFNEIQFVDLKHMDTSFLLILTVLGITLLIGLGVAFVGLAYHHHRRHHELMRTHHAPTAPAASPSPPETSKQVSP